jgi:tetratricopeptide (TPR) repeat protein
LLKAACEQDDTNPVAFWILGWVYDELGLCEKSIEANQKTLALDPRFAPWAYWTIAVSQLKQDKLDLALEALQLIPPGPWWLEMYKDEEISRLKQDLRFGALYKERRFYDPQRYQLTPMR